MFGILVEKKEKEGGAFPLGLLASIGPPILGEITKPILGKIFGRGRKLKRRRRRKEEDDDYETENQVKKKNNSKSCYITKWNNLHIEI